MQPDRSLLAFDTRLGQFETRFGEALEDVATRADIENLRQVEKQIDELAEHIGHAQQQLQRLDTIEAQLNAVMDQLSDQRMAAFFERPDSADLDIDSWASAAAEQVATRLSAMAPERPEEEPADETRLEELRDLIHSFMIERRHGEEQTTGMLDTMQQAMIRLLDRVDALEVTSAPAPAAVDADYVEYSVRASSQPPRIPPEALYRSPRDQEDSDTDAPSTSGTPASGTTDTIAVDETDRAYRSADDNTMEMGAGRPQEEPSLDHEHAHGRVLAEANATPETKPAEETTTAYALHSDNASDELNGGSQTREQLIAEARRAMQSAAKQQQEEAEREEDAKPAKGKRGLRKDKAFVGTDAPVGISTSTRRIMIGACTLLLLSSAVLLMMPRRQAAPPPAPKVMMPENPAAQREGAVQGSAGATLEKQASAADSYDARYRQALADESSKANPIPGIIVHQGGGVMGADGASVLEQQELAELSTQPGNAEGADGIMPSSVVPVAVRIGGEPQEGRTVPQEMPPALIGPTSLRLAAAEGDPSAEFEVAARFAEGKGIRQDFKQAARWYQRSASQGFALAQYRLGTLYERGLGVSADLARARVWYARAAELGNVKAMHNLAVLSAGRDRSTPDYTTAAHWFTQAADLGLADSQYNLAVLHETGLGVAKDMVQAYKWFAIAARGGDQESRRRLELAKMKMSASEIASADRLVASWSTKPADKLVNDALAAGQIWKSRTTAKAS